ncbi:MAG TPA: LacI family DNA-binding transcriptional regulator [Candidatus Limnocylindrales bacterium]|nr:LacI family DNA-binding transcriptional regulator [Candidatus Limnocylindrales bacterium]
MQPRTDPDSTPAADSPASDSPGVDSPGAPEAADGRRRRPRPGRTGSHPATIEQVAARAGVSTATVSRVLTNRKPVRPETRRRVLEAADALDYVPSGPARALAGSPTGMLGLLMTDLTQPFYTELAHAIESEAQARGYTLILANGAGDSGREASYLDLLAQRRVDGILVASRGVTTRHIDWLRRAPVEVVLVTCEAPGVPLPAIVAASRDGAALAAEHVLALGHRRIAEIVGPAVSASAPERHAGIVEALARAGIPERDLVVECGDADVAGGRAAAEALLAGPSRPTAILCYNDLVAVGALHAIAAAGLEVPHDVSVVGFDDIPVASMVSPALTTVAQAVGEMARWSVARITAQIAAHRGEGVVEPPEVVRMPCRLVIRGSTAAPPG